MARGGIQGHANRPNLHFNPHPYRPTYVDGRKRANDRCHRIAGRG